MPTDIERIQYGYDRLGNRVWRKNLVASGGNDELYAYDDLSRLVDMARGDLNEARTAVADASFAQSWQLDATGNWPGFRQVDTADPTQNLDQQRTANRANEILSFARRYGPEWAQPSYDRAGNMTAFPQPQAPSAAFTAVYDAWNRLVSVSDGEEVVASYTYDARGFRITSTSGGSTRHSYYTAGWQVLEERIDSSTDAERQFLWGLRYIDDLVLRDRDTDDNGELDERFYAVQDANWNVTAIADPTGEAQERYRYSAYGVVAFLESSFDPRPLNESNHDWNSLFTGQHLAALTLPYSYLYYFRSRFYDATTGAFICRDPLVVGHNNNESHTAAPSLQPRSCKYGSHSAGRSTVLLSHQQTYYHCNGIIDELLLSITRHIWWNSEHLHLYGYANNNPINRVDPRGTQAQPNQQHINCLNAASRYRLHCYIRAAILCELVCLGGAGGGPRGGGTIKLTPACAACIAGYGLACEEGYKCDVEYCNDILKGCESTWSRIWCGGSLLMSF